MVQQPKIKAAKIIRLVETNLDAAKQVKVAIRSIPGIGHIFSNAISVVSGIGDKTLESLSEAEIKTLTDIIQNPGNHSIPSWMFNRKKDPIQGGDRHIVASTLEFAKKMDINEMKKLKIYRGIRHSQGLPVRGQRTRGSFRKGKVVGVSKKKQQPTKSKKK